MTKNPWHTHKTTSCTQVNRQGAPRCTIVACAYARSARNLRLGSWGVQRSLEKPPPSQKEEVHACPTYDSGSILWGRAGGAGADTSPPSPPSPPAGTMAGAGMDSGGRRPLLTSNACMSRPDTTRSSTNDVITWPHRGCTCGPGTRDIANRGRGWGNIGWPPSGGAAAVHP